MNPRRSNSVKPMRKLLHTSATLLLLLSWVHQSAGLPDDRQQPIRVTADSAIRDDQAGITRYEGNVRLIQGSLEITANRISITHDRQAMSLIVAEGEPATMSQLPAVDEPEIKAAATRIEYLRTEDRVRLMTDARIEQDGTIVTGDLIDYLVTEQRVMATGTEESGGQRVEVVIPPSAFEKDT